MYAARTEPSVTAGGIGCGLIVAFFLAWLTHIVVCLTAGKWGFLIAGAIMFPIAIIHGILIWFGIA